MDTLAAINPALASSTTRAPRVTGLAPAAAVAAWAADLALRWAYP
jgi:hypothetical protein